MKESAATHSRRVAEVLDFEPGTPLQAVASDPAPREALRRAAVAQLQAAGRDRELAEAWTQLCSGELAIADVFTAGGETIGLLEPREAVAAAAACIRGRRLQLLERVLGGDPLTCVSLDFGLSTSTVSTEFRRALVSLGTGGLLAQLPSFVVHLCLAKTSGHPLTSKGCWVEWAGSRHLAIAVQRTGPEGLDSLSPAENQVCGLLLEGLSYGEISKSRRTSPRTTANQVSSVFRKLRVSGRLELLVTLVRRISGVGEVEDAKQATRTALAASATATAVQS